MRANIRTIRNTALRTSAGAVSLTAGLLENVAGSLRKLAQDPQPQQHEEQPQEQPQPAAAKQPQPVPVPVPVQTAAPAVETHAPDGGTPKKAVAAMPRISNPKAARKARQRLNT